MAGDDMPTLKELLAVDSIATMAAMLKSNASVDDWRNLVKGVGQPLLVTSADGTIVFANKGLRERSGAKIGEKCCDSICDSFEELDCFTADTISKAYFNVYEVQRLPKRMIIIRVPLQTLGMITIFKIREAGEEVKRKGGRQRGLFEIVRPERDRRGNKKTNKPRKRDHRRSGD